MYNTCDWVYSWQLGTFVSFTAPELYWEGSYMSPIYLSFSLPQGRNATEKKPQQVLVTCTDRCSDPYISWKDYCSHFYHTLLGCRHGAYLIHMIYTTCESSWWGKQNLLLTISFAFKYNTLSFFSSSSYLQSTVNAHIFKTQELVLPHHL